MKKPNKLTSEEYEDRICWTINQKIDHAIGTVEAFSNYHEGKIYVAYSGGKDSTVLLWLVRKIFPDTVGVFCDTGLEYPEIREFVKQTENIEWVYPEKSFKFVLENIGYPVVSKVQARYIQQYREGTKYIKNLRMKGRVYGGNLGYKISEQWKYLIEAPFKISDKCCDVMKKKPMKIYEKNTGKKPIIGIMSTESSERKRQALQDGCNIFGKTSISRPLLYFYEREIWEIIKKYRLPYSKIYDMGYKRTGCMFCMFGAHLNSPNHFQIMAKTHPKQYIYCMDKLKLRQILRYLKIPIHPVCEKQLSLWD